MKSYKILFHPEAVKEINALDKGVRIRVLKQIKKLEQAPGLGGELGNKQGFDLSGYRKLYAEKKRIRVVYKIEEEMVVVQVVAVGRREGLKVYQDAARRL